MRPGKVRTVGEPRIRVVRLYAQELRVNERVQHALAHGALDAAETLRLFAGQPQTRHFEKLGAKTVDECVMRHYDLSTADVVAGSI